ncbi:uncharacterized protein [Cicer arietinum]|uniref:uncharacterized protein n=1 Tax=Cicer arietinum TaxID=3827 RepID=UPI003CC526A2
MNQLTIRCDILSGLQEVVHSRETHTSAVGKRLVLPTSFTGDLRYMFNNCQDAMAICKKFGYPNLFISITCNANWQNFVSIRGLKTSDRTYIICRVFKAKLDHMTSDFKKEKIFGEIVAVDDEGYPKYKRRDTSLSVLKKGISLDNRFVVPYNPHLLMKYQAHVNVEYYNKGNSIKYLFKYVNKGPDRAAIEISNQTKNGHVLDEIKQYYECRYLALCEAV